MTVWRWIEFVSREIGFDCASENNVPCVCVAP